MNFKCDEPGMATVCMCFNRFVAFFSSIHSYHSECDVFYQVCHLDLTSALDKSPFLIQSKARIDLFIINFVATQGMPSPLDFQFSFPSFFHLA